MHVLLFEKERAKAKVFEAEINKLVVNSVSLYFVIFFANFVSKLIVTTQTLNGLTDFDELVMRVSLRPSHKGQYGGGRCNVTIS